MGIIICRRWNSFNSNIYKITILIFEYFIVRGEMNEKSMEIY